MVGKAEVKMEPKASMGLHKMQGHTEEDIFFLSQTHNGGGRQASKHAETHSKKEEK